MLAKLNFLQSKYYIVLIALITILVQPLSAAKTKSCNYRVFNIKTVEKVASIELLTQIADSCDFSIVVKDNVAATLLQKELYGINIKNLSLNEIFEVLIADNDLYYEYTKNFLKISALKTKTFKVDYITSIRQGTANLSASVDIKITEGDTGGTTTANGDNSINSNDTFDFWSTMLAEVTAILNTGEEDYVAKAPIINANAGLITVTGTKKQLDRVEKYLKELEEKLHKQVLIDVSIISVDLEKNKNTGIDWSKLQLELRSTAKFNNSSRNSSGSHNTYTNPIDSGLSFANNKLAVVNDAVFTMTGLIDFLNTNGDTKVISNPKVLSMNNQQALITIGDNINYRIPEDTSDGDTGDTSTTYKNYSIFIGVLLNITPQITENSEIILRINPSVSNFKYTEDDGKQTNAREIAPDTSEKKLSTVVKVKNGNTIILGGLITNSENSDNSSVPILSSIPLLGEAFKHEGISKTTKELIFVITPRIIGPKDHTKATLKDLGFSKRIYEQ
ncbi:pilus (MSHA type) biogenesis protein MshL [Sulfurospirillum arcachonense]|uniref:pilus (MSHA type) biogenesis protein MshL n=1 Tax=Sulfurospirillum arcachonense TaxID=57666 RepID=UPI00046815FC|nr:pilus (MSHA type) biogenesis protein MshL [Sulfurospirillum arcachonense]